MAAIQGSLRTIFVLTLTLASAAPALTQSSSLGNGLSAAAVGRGESQTAERGDPIDAIEGNPAGLAGVHTRVLEAGGIGVFGSGSFANSVNTNGRMGGVVGGMPYGAFAVPLGRSAWTASVGFTPEVVMRANWHYADAPGTAGVTYGVQTNEAEIIAVRSSIGIARSLGRHFAAGAVLGLVYNQNNLNAPYIFQQQPQLAGLKVLLSLKTHGWGWNGNAGMQWQPSQSVRLGLAWKSGTTIHTTGTADGTASALFQALGIQADPNFHYQVKILNQLPQAVNAGVSWRQSSRLLWQAEGDFIGWGNAFQQLPITLTGGTNPTINSVAGSSALQDAVPLHWKNQTGVHAGVEVPVREEWTLRAGYSFMTDPVPPSTLLPMTAAITRNAFAAGAGWTRGRFHADAAYQAQLPHTESVGHSSIAGGEYDNSRVRLWLQSVTVTTIYRF